MSNSFSISAIKGFINIRIKVLFFTFFIFYLLSYNDRLAPCCVSRFAAQVSSSFRHTFVIGLKFCECDFLSSCLFCCYRRPTVEKNNWFLQFFGWYKMLVQHSIVNLHRKCQFPICSFSKRRTHFVSFSSKIIS